MTLFSSSLVKYAITVGEMSLTYSPVLVVLILAILFLITLFVAYRGIMRLADRCKSLDVSWKGLSFIAADSSGNSSGKRNTQLQRPPSNPRSPKPLAQPTPPQLAPPNPPKSPPRRKPKQKPQSKP